MRVVKARWYYGETRLGKTWKAIQDLGFDPKAPMTGLYFKQQNSWWDKYNGEDAVLLDELPFTATWAITFLK